MGRVTTYTPEIGDEICKRIREKDSLRKITEDPAMPAMSTICHWFHSQPLFYREYIKAKEIRAELMFDELIDLADEEEVKTFEQVNKMNMRINTRKWCLARMNQTRFGDKTDVNHGGLEGLAGALLKARERVNE